MTPEAHTADRDRVAAHGPIRLAGGAPVRLPAGVRAWKIAEGTAEIYVVWPGGRRLLAVLEKDDIAFGLDGEAGRALHLVGPAGTELIPFHPDADELAPAAERWLRALGSRLAGDPPADAQEPEAGAPLVVHAGEALASPARLLWLAPSGGALLSVAGAECGAAALSAVPLIDRLWARAGAGGQVKPARTADLDADGIWRALADISIWLVPVLEADARAADDAALARIGGSPAGPEAAVAAETAIGAIAEALGMDPHDLPRLPANASSLAVPALARIAGLRARRIALDDGWHRAGLGPLIVKRDADSPIEALIPDGNGYRDASGTRLREPAKGGRPRLAYAMQSPLPETVQGFWSLAWHGLAGASRRDAALACIAAGGAAILGSLVPLAAGWLLSDIVPAGMARLLVAVGVALASAAVITLLLSTAREIATARIEGRSAMTIGAALTDRLLRLPPGFFRDFSAGDLNQRIESVDEVRRLGISVVMSSGLTAVLSVVYLAVLLVYDPRLALLGIALVAIYALAVVVARLLQLRAIREAAELDGEIAGQTFETLEGIAKLRSVAGEERAMARWLALYARERDARVAAGRVGIGFSAFADAYQIITLMVLFAGAGALVAREAPAGLFIGFLAAFGAFQGAFVAFSRSLLQVWSVQPLVERARPILTARPEFDAARADPGPLKGAIEASGLTFAYGTGLAPVLNDLNFRVAPGEHVAIVGASGSGKSTLLRILLGFETPQRGSVLFDGQDLAHLDRTRVRSQIGVVLQSSHLMAGSILENIRGASAASLEDCMMAAERVGLTRDLKEFPMGIHTPVTDGASALSGGQRQRILVARALSANPRMLFFDEATSALDNVAQAVVARTLDALTITRITIAHRLSTVRNADRICVLQDGRFVEEGRFDDLMAADGPFARLAERQMIGD